MPVLPAASERPNILVAVHVAGRAVEQKAVMLVAHVRLGHAEARVVLITGFYVEGRPKVGAIVLR